MGRHTSDKKRFDDLAKEFFQSQGYEAEAGFGGRLADVVAWQPDTREFAVVEVKSPREPDAAIHFSSEESYSDLGGISREKIWELIKEQDFAIGSPGLARLIAFTVSSQLYTYWVKSGEHIEKFQNKTGKRISPCRIAAFLVLPLEHKRIAMQVLEFFRERRMIENFPIKDAEEICVFEIFYPEGRREMPQG